MLKKLSLGKLSKVSEDLLEKDHHTIFQIFIRFIDRGSSWSNDRSSLEFSFHLFNEHRSLTNLRIALIDLNQNFHRILHRSFFSLSKVSSTKSEIHLSLKVAAICFQSSASSAN